MARKLGNTDSDTQFEDSNSTSDSNEGNTEMSTDTDTQPEAEVTESGDTETTEAPAAEVTEDKAPEPVDMTDFISAVEAGLADRDPSTGTVPDSHLEAVKTAYQALPVGGKSKAKTHLLAEMTAGVEGGDLSKAMAASQLSKALVPAKSSSTKAPAEPKAPADPNEAVATQLAVLRTAFVHIQANLPEGAEDEAVKAKVKELGDASAAELEGYLTWLDRDEPAEGTEDSPEPEVSQVTKKAAKLIRTKVRVSTASSGGGGSTYSGPRRNVATHISQVFADKAPGDFMSIAEIANASSEEYGSDKVSSGAVTARLYPTEGTCSLTDVTPASKDGKRGATKN